MARYTGPKSKIERKYGEPILGSGKTLTKKGYRPGQHGRKRTRTSEYGDQLKKKQKFKYIYGILEKQFFLYFKKASAQLGDTGEILVQKLEQRLDNVVYRLGLAPTRRAARQLVGHKHILVNGKLVNIPSYAVSPGDVITVHTKSTGKISASDNHATQYPWLSWNPKEKKGTFLELPTLENVPEKIDPQSVIELYSR